MKIKIMLLAIGAALLLTACGQVERSSTETTLPPTPAAQEEAQQPQATPEPATAAQEMDTVPITAQEQPQKENTHQEESAPQTANPPEPVTEPAPAEDIPSVTVSAKTGYDADSVQTPAPEGELESAPAPEPAPEPAAPANRQAAIDVANAYASTQYGVTTDTSLALDNSAYRFPAAVPLDASQETLEAKARDMVDFTFRQLMMQAGVDTIADAGFCCNVYIVEDGGSLLIYVLYDG